MNPVRGRRGRVDGSSRSGVEERHGWVETVDPYKKVGAEASSLSEKGRRPIPPSTRVDRGGGSRPGRHTWTSAGTSTRRTGTRPGSTGVDGGTGRGSRSRSVTARRTTTSGHRSGWLSTLHIREGRRRGPRRTEGHLDLSGGVKGRTGGGGVCVDLRLLRLGHKLLALPHLLMLLYGYGHIGGGSLSAPWLPAPLSDHPTPRGRVRGGRKNKFTY